MSHILRFLIAGILLVGCAPSLRTPAAKDDGKIEVYFIQVNDVYEIDTLQSTGLGGIARIATLKKEYKHVNDNSFLVMAGDFLSPSVFLNLSEGKKRIPGKQMIEAMNAARFDFVIFGNHEFDIRESELQDRIDESNFAWIASNTFHARPDGLTVFESKQKAGFPLFHVLNVKDRDGTSAKIGIIALTLPDNKAKYVAYADAFQIATVLYAELTKTCDAVLAITHQSMSDDIKLAQSLPGLSAILGGHEHDGQFAKVDNVYITKAISNAKNAYVVKLNIDRGKHIVKVETQKRDLDKTIVLDSATNNIVKRWMGIMYDSVRSWGFSPESVIINSGEPLEARDAESRRHPTNFTRLIVKAMEYARPEAEVVLLNAGSIRIDDILTPPVTEYDILRSLPYRGSIREAQVKGNILLQALATGMTNANSGGFLLRNEAVHYDSGARTWLIKDTAIDTSRWYRVAFADFLLTGNERGLAFLNVNNPDIRVFNEVVLPNDPKSDICLAVINYLKKFKAN